jgi:hypothetical protein
MTVIARFRRRSRVLVHVCTATLVLAGFCTALGPCGIAAAAMAPKAPGAEAASHVHHARAQPDLATAAHVHSTLAQSDTSSVVVPDRHPCPHCGGPSSSHDCDGGGNHWCKLEAPSLARTVQAAFPSGEPGKLILLSPAAAVPHSPMHPPDPPAARRLNQTYRAVHPIRQFGVLLI